VVLWGGLLAARPKGDPRVRGTKAVEDGENEVCWHCGLPNAPGAPWRLVVAGVERHFCCAGCRGIAQVIDAAGLDAFYARRDICDVVGREPLPPSRNDVAAAAASVVTRGADGHAEVSLLLEGIHCAACVWLIETWLQRQPGIVAAHVNFATRRAEVRWDAQALDLAGVLAAVAAIGYRAYPYDPARREALARRESRALLARAAIALLAMMQVMMFATPGYISADVEPEYRVLLEWASLLLTLPVVLYCATPFFSGAWRNLRIGRPGMDVPVAIGVAGAFAASAVATVRGTGDVYYDSVTMFVALLLTARWFELRARQNAGAAIEAITRDLPEMAERLADYPASMRVETVPARSLAVGESIRIAAGAAIPADGRVVAGQSSVEEAVLTGESRPRLKRVGDDVLAGSINGETPLVVRVSAAGEATTLAALSRLVAQAATERPRVSRVADRVALWFVSALLLIAAITGLVWWQHDPARALMVTFAVLVVSCPCALSLATPAALAAAAGALGRHRVLAVRRDALETLSRVSHVVLDKTGTLTAGRVERLAVDVLGGRDRNECLRIAAALEQGVAHPIARALCANVTPAHVAAEIIVVGGSGVEGVVEGCRYRCGRPEWVARLHGLALPSNVESIGPDRTPVALADDRGWLACFAFGDVLRPSAAPLVASLHAMGITVSLLSGDRTATVREVALAVGIDDFRGDATPEDKRADIAARQRAGAVVAMVGDGINDAPSLAQADVSLSLESAAALTQWTADVVLLGEDLVRVADAIACARKTFRVIRQNLGWAFAYNFVAIPLAATGYVTPIFAAVGMSLSSLLVVANALRLVRVRAAGTMPAARAGVAPLVTAH
jgi:Cu2+-exporting ATPase